MPLGKRHTLPSPCAHDHISGQFPASTNQGLRLANCAASICRPARNRHAACRWLGRRSCHVFLADAVSLLIRFGPLERAESHSATSLDKVESASDSKKFQNRGPPGHQPAVLGPSSAIAARHVPWTGPASEGPDLSARIAVQRGSL